MQAGAQPLQHSPTLTPSKASPPHTVAGATLGCPAPGLLGSPQLHQAFCPQRGTATSLPQAPRAASGTRASPRRMCASPAGAVGTVQSWQGMDRRGRGGHEPWSVPALLPSCFLAGSLQQGLDPTRVAKRYLVLQNNIIGFIPVLFWLYPAPQPGKGDPAVAQPRAWGKPPSHGPAYGTGPMEAVPASLPTCGVTGSGFSQESPCPQGKPMPRPDPSLPGCQWSQGRSQQQDAQPAPEPGEGRVGDRGICPATF